MEMQNSHLHLHLLQTTSQMSSQSIASISTAASKLDVPVKGLSLPLSSSQNSIAIALPIEADDERDLGCTVDGAPSTCLAADISNARSPTQALLDNVSLALTLLDEPPATPSMPATKDVHQRQAEEGQGMEIQLSDLLRTAGKELPQRRDVGFPLHTSAIHPVMQSVWYDFTRCGFERTPGGTTTDSCLMNTSLIQPCLPLPSFRSSSSSVSLLPGACHSSSHPSLHAKDAYHPASSQEQAHKQKPSVVQSPVPADAEEAEHRVSLASLGLEPVALALPQVASLFPSFSPLTYEGATEAEEVDSAYVTSSFPLLSPLAYVAADAEKHRVSLVGLGLEPAALSPAQVASSFPSISSFSYVAALMARDPIVAAASTASVGIVDGFSSSGSTGHRIVTEKASAGLCSVLAENVYPSGGSGTGTFEQRSDISSVSNHSSATYVEHTGIEPSGVLPRVPFWEARQYESGVGNWLLSISGVERIAPSEDDEANPSSPTFVIINFNDARRRGAQIEPIGVLSAYAEVEPIGVLCSPEVLELRPSTSSTLSVYSDVGSEYSRSSSEADGPVSCARHRRVLQLTKGEAEAPRAPQAFVRRPTRLSQSFVPSEVDPRSPVPLNVPFVPESRPLVVPTSAPAPSGASKGALFIPAPRPLVVPTTNTIPFPSPPVVAPSPPSVRTGKAESIAPAVDTTHTPPMSTPDVCTALPALAEGPPPASAEVSPPHRQVLEARAGPRRILRIPRFTARLFAARRVPAPATATPPPSISPACTSNGPVSAPVSSPVGSRSARISAAFRNIARRLRRSRPGSG